ncbi:hypothetical protein C8R47DRAFT_1167608 [Mycena vitilis]|nr:hypothetical protein C8R47DRAFT_1167608 [Mycena vitilis]
MFEGIQPGPLLMSSTTVEHDHGVSNKFRPKRGTLFQSHPEAVDFSFAKFSLVMALSLYPFILAFVLFSFRFHLGPLATLPSGDLIYMLVYYSSCMCAASISVASYFFPTSFRFHSTLTVLLYGRRRHRSHFSFMSQRRMRGVCGHRERFFMSETTERRMRRVLCMLRHVYGMLRRVFGMHQYTIFIMGLSSCTVPVEPQQARFIATCLRLDWFQSSSLTACISFTVAVALHGAIQCSLWALLPFLI